MVKKLLVIAPLLAALFAPLPADAKSSWNYVGRITARGVTTFTVFDREHVAITVDERTTVMPWIREKPYVRKASYLTPSALTFGTLVRVRTRPGEHVADVVEVARDVKTVFDGRVIAFNGTSVSITDEDMDVVTLRIGPRTALRELFTVKPWVRPAVALAPSDLKVGALVKLFSSKEETLTASRVEIAKAEPLRIPPQALANIDN